MILREYLEKIPLSIILFIIIFFILISLCCSLKIGYIDISAKDIILGVASNFRIISNKEIDENVFDIVYSLRMPRAFLALATGMGLTLSGIVMQAILKNPLADPYILGISSGASLGATSAIFLGLGTFWSKQFIGISAFLGAFFVSFLIIIINKMMNKNDISNLLLLGVAIGSICTSFTGLITYFGQSKEGMEAITYWLMGNIANAKFENVIILLIIVFIVFIYFLSQRRILNLMLLGHEVAITLGVDLNLYLKKYLILNGILVGFIVFNSGMIGFIGLLMPHIFRILLGNNHYKFFPVAVLGGGLITLLVDIISRTVIRGIDIPLGIVFSLIGVPVFIYLIIKKDYRFD